MDEYSVISDGRFNLTDMVKGRLGTVILTMKSSLEVVYCRHGGRGPSCETYRYKCIATVKRLVKE